MHRAIKQSVDAEREGHLLDPAGGGEGIPPAAFKRQGELRANGVGHQLRLRILEERPGEHAQLCWAVVARVQAGELHGAGEPSALKVGYEPTGGAEKGRLALTGEAGQQADLPRLDIEPDIAQGRRVGAGVVVGDTPEGEHGAHASMPRRSRKGSNAMATSAAHRANVEPVKAPWMIGYA